jgi:hypothetical protein
MPAFTFAPPLCRVSPPDPVASRGLLRRLRSCVAAAVGAGLVLAAFADSSPLAAASPSAGGPVRHWNAVAGRAAIAACLAPAANPLAEARLYAMTHIAIHDAVNAIDPRFAHYAADLFAEPGTSVDAAVAAASRTVMVSLFTELSDPPSAPCGARGAALVEREYVSALQRIPAGPAREEGLVLGRRAAGKILESRRGPGGSSYRAQPGLLLGFAGPFGPTPATPVPSLPPQAALSWLESGPASWNRLARVVSTRRHLDVWEQAKLFALANIALADGYGSSHARNDGHSSKPRRPQEASGEGSPPYRLMAELHPLVVTRLGRALPE